MVSVNLFLLGLNQGKNRNLCLYASEFPRYGLKHKTRLIPDLNTCTTVVVMTTMEARNISDYVQWKDAISLELDLYFFLFFLNKLI